MKTQTFVFNSRTVKTSKPSEALTALQSLVNDLNQIDFLDVNGKVISGADWQHPQVIAAKRKPQTREVAVCDFGDLLADEAKGTYILNQLISDAQFAIVRAQFDASTNGNLDSYELTVQALYDFVTPVTSSGGNSTKIKKSDIKALALKFGQYLQSVGVSAKGTALMFSLAAEGFANTVGIDANLWMPIQSRFTAFKEEADFADIEVDVLEYLEKNLAIAVASNSKVSAADL